MISPKTRMMGLPYGEEIMIVGRTMWTQSTSVTDRRTDGQTDRITITDTVQRIASHGKNVTKAMLHIKTIQCHKRKHYLILNVSNINVVMTCKKKCSNSITKVQGHSDQMSKISGQFLMSGQFQDNCEISGQLGALQKQQRL